MNKRLRSSIRVRSTFAILPDNVPNVITFHNRHLPHNDTAMNLGDKHRAGTIAAPSFSLLRLSALARLGGALVVIAALWATVFWALA
jgi:hypothetical protein